MAQSPSQWAADEVLARATLPLTAGSDVLEANLSCEARRWTLALMLTEGTPLQAGDAILSVDGRAFDLRVSLADGGLSMTMPREALEPLANGLRMQVGFSGALADDLGEVVFPLRGSRVAIGAVEDKCTQRDMSAYRAVTFTPYSSYINLARELRTDDIAAFETATASQPQVSAAMAEMGEGRRVLFTRLCGSSWYYGLSGCNITGFVAEAQPNAQGSEEADTWRAVYDTEDVAMHLDPQSLSHGWADLVTLPARGAGSGLVWRWDGRGYGLKGELPEEEDVVEALRLRPAHD